MKIKNPRIQTVYSHLCWRALGEVRGDGISYVCACKIPEITTGWLLLRWGTRVCRWKPSVHHLRCCFHCYSFDCKQRRMYGQSRFPISFYLFWHLKDSEVKRAFPCNSWEDTELLEAGQEPRHQRDGFITCVLSLGQKGSALSSTPARVMRFRLAIVWGTGELSAEQGRGELREVGDGDLSMEPGCVGGGGGGKTKEGGRRSEPRAATGALRSQD